MLPTERSTSPDSVEMLGVAQKLGVEVVWDRYLAQLPQCGFGETGLCCRHCLQGPCRIDPFGNGPRVGVCGATADTFVARGLDRAIAAGTAAHSGHAKHLAHTLKKLAEGKAPDYHIKEPAKLRAVAERQGVKLDGKPDEVIAGELADLALEEFSERHDPVRWTTKTLTAARLKKFGEMGLLPYGIDSAISEVMHRTTNGVDADPVNLLLGGIKCAIADYDGMALATDLSDILFGVPQPTVAAANLGTLKKNAVNIAVQPQGEESPAARGIAVGDLRSGVNLEMLPTEAEIKQGDLVTTSGLGGNYPRALDGLCKVLSLDMRVIDPAWIGMKLRKLLNFGEPLGDFMARVPGGDKMESYPSTVSYVAKLIIHRYAMLGILDENGYPVQQMGVLEVPEAQNKASGIKTMVGKVCKECGNATLIKKDGCEFCTSCGTIGACG